MIKGNEGRVEIGAETKPLNNALSLFDNFLFRVITSKPRGMAWRP